MNNRKIKAYGKINIGLEVLDKRTDGYHNINSIMTRICLHDDITLTLDDDITVTCTPDINILQENNIAYKAALAVKNFYCIRDKGVKIEIKKNIPVGAGLGGGSSDAASVINGLIELWDIEPGFGDNDSLSMLIGSDVPYFMHEGIAIVNGKGDDLEFIDYTLPFWILLIYPNIEISTKWAYNSLNRISHTSYFQSDLKFYLFESLKKPELLREFVHNDFEQIVFDHFPQLKLIKDLLYRKGAIFASLSGSGSTVYGFYESRKQCEAAALRFSDYRNFICPPGFFD